MSSDCSPFHEGTEHPASGLSCAEPGSGLVELLVQDLQAFLFEQLQLAGFEAAAVGQAPVPGRPTVLRAPPRRFTGTLNEAPRPPTEIELRPFLEK